MLAWLGYEVVAIDVSRIAIEHLEKRPATVGELARWLRMRGSPLETAEALALLGPASKGSLELVCTDFRDYAPSQTFDVVYCPWSWQCLDGDGRRELAQHAFAWTAPGGACRIATQNLTKDRSSELDRVFQEAGFFQRYETSSAYLKSSEHDCSRRAWERHTELADEDDERARTRLDRGEKAYDVYNASE